jgi:hypothetical protein
MKEAVKRIMHGVSLVAQSDGLHNTSPLNLLANIRSIKEAGLGSLVGANALQVAAVSLRDSLNKICHLFLLIFNTSTS